MCLLAFRGTSVWGTSVGITQLQSGAFVGSLLNPSLLLQVGAGNGNVNGVGNLGSYNGNGNGECLGQHKFAVAYSSNVVPVRIVASI